jgi:hypothetical protein
LMEVSSERCEKGPISLSLLPQKAHNGWISTS